MSGLDAVLELLRDRAGLDFPASRRDVAATAVHRAMQAAGDGDEEAYHARLLRDPAELERLLAEATVGETYFFRDPGQWEVIRAQAIPEILARRGPAHTLRAWSAACSTGEEAYTLALVCHEAGVPRRRIVGTDVSEPRLAAARAGRYRKWSFRGVPEETVAAYFSRRGTELVLDAGVRGGVDFRRLNLAVDGLPVLDGVPGEMDLVLCRNVLIYFDPPTVARVARRLYNALAPGGWLVLGASDPSLADHVACDVLVTPAGLVYRKPAGPRIVAAPHRAEPTFTAPPPSPAFSVDGTAAGEEDEVARWLDELRPPADPPPPLVATSSAAAGGAEARYAARDYAGAAEAARERLAEGDDRAETWEVLVRALANRGALADAEASCVRALERHRGAAVLHHLHAVLLAGAGRHAESLAAARQAVYLDPDLAVAHVDLAAAAARVGSHEAARRALRSAERLLQAHPPGEVVRASDGETAAHLLRAVRARLALLREGAA